MKTIMGIAVALNVIVLGQAWMIFRHGTDWVDEWTLGVMVAAPISNLIALQIARRKSRNDAQ